MPSTPMSDHLSPIPWLDVLLILALIALNGVLSMSELAIVSSREARLKAMAKTGSGGAQCALQLAAEPGRFLSTVQSGITLISIINGAFSGASLGEPTAERFEALGLGHDTAHTVGFGLVIVLTTFVSLVIGEMVPKQFDAQHRAFYVNELGVIRGEEEKQATEDSPPVKSGR